MTRKQFFNALNVIVTSKDRDIAQLNYDLIKDVKLFKKDPEANYYLTQLVTYSGYWNYEEIIDSIRVCYEQYYESINNCKQRIPYNQLKRMK